MSLFWNFAGILGSLGSQSYSVGSSSSSILSSFPAPSVMDDAEEDQSTETSVNHANNMPVPVTAVVGGKATLPCTVMSPFNDSVDLILWFKGDEETALYSLDARSSGSFQRAKHFPSDDLSSRAYIDIAGKPSTSLVFESIKASDAGRYKCRVGEYILETMDKIQLHGSTAWHRRKHRTLSSSDCVIKREKWFRDQLSGVTQRQ